MTIGGSRFQSPLVELEMHAGEQLLRFISTAGKQGAFERLHQPFRLQLERHAALHHRKIGIVVSAHAAHLIAAAEAGELNLLTGIVYGEGDRRIAGQAGHDLSQQPGRQCDGPAGFHTGGEGRLNSQAQVKTGQAEAVAAGIGGEQHIGQNRVRGACGDCTAHQLQSAIQFGL